MNNGISKLCKKAISKNDIAILLTNSKKGIGTSSIIECLSENKGYIYFLLKAEKVVYIGASGNRRRIEAHQKDKDFDSFCYILCEKEYDHLHLETLLIRQFKTKYNRCNVAKSAHKSKAKPIKQ